MKLNIVKAQTNALREILARAAEDNVDQLTKIREAMSWKCVVFDRASMTKAALLMNKGQLKECGVMSHTILSNRREPVMDLPACYIIEPTAEALEQIRVDMTKQMYLGYEIHFTSECPEQILKNFAISCAESGVEHLVDKVEEHSFNFLSYDQRLFDLDIKDSFAVLNGANTTDEDVEALIQKVVDGLFAVFTSMGALPFIKAQPGGAAEMVASALDEKLRQYILKNRDHVFRSALSSDRPALVLYDRLSDVATPLHHSWRYQDFIHDTSTIEQNRTNIFMTGNDGRSSKKSIDLDSQDEFWETNKSLPFPEVAPEVESKLNEYRAASDKITKLSGQAHEEGDGSAASAASLKLAIENLPKLQAQKAKLELHTSLAHTLLHQLKTRELDKYYSVEDALLTGQNADKAVLASVLEPDTPGTLEDKVRTMTIHFACASDEKRQAMASQENALRAAGADLRPINFLKHTRAFDTKSDTKTSIFSSITGKVKAALSNSKDVYCTRLANQVLDSKQADAINVSTYDPKQTSQSASRSSRQGRGPCGKAVVFCVGPASYTEAHNLQDMAQRSNREILFGATHFPTPLQWLKELSDLGPKDKAVNEAAD